MNRLVVLVIVLAACGDNDKGNLVYKDPPAGGALRLVRDTSSKPDKAVLDLVVGDQPLVGYSTGFDLPMDATKVTLGAFTPATALDPGSAPAASSAAIPADGPLAGNLVVALSQKASGTGAIATDATLAPGTRLLQLELDRAEPIMSGVVFDGTSPDFKLPSGGLRDRAGNTVVGEADVAIGKLFIP
jgi:hypothetical protein